MIKAGIFDIGGVLINWNNVPMFADIDKTLGINEVQRHAVWKTHMDKLEVGKISEDEFWQLFIKDTKPSKPLPDRSLLLSEFKKVFQSIINSDVMAIAKTMKTNGYPLAILSNTIDPHANYMKTTNLFSGFDEIILSNEVGFRKPEKEIYELTLDRLGLKADETFFVDDLPQNIEGANEVGIHGILFQDAEKLRASLIGLGVKL